MVTFCFHLHIHLSVFSDDDRLFYVEILESLTKICLILWSSAKDVELKILFDQHQEASLVGLLFPKTLQI